MPTSEKVPETLKTTLYFVHGLANIKVYDAVAKAILPKWKLVPRHYSMLCVLEQKGPLSQQDLADAIGVNRNAIVSLIDELEKMGYATRKANPENRRQNHITISDKGRRTLIEAKSAVAEATIAATPILTDQQRSTLLELSALVALD